MKNKFALMVVFFAMGLASLLFGAERVRYPAPRFPSYLKPPKSIDDFILLGAEASRSCVAATINGALRSDVIWNAAQPGKRLTAVLRTRM